jgi:hypothetical protein
VKIIRAFGLSFLVAAFLYGFFLTQQHLANHIWQDGFKKGVDAALSLCSNHKLHIPPAGETQAQIRGNLESQGDEDLRHRHAGEDS